MNPIYLRTYWDPVQGTTAEAEVFEDFRDANAPPIAPATTATTINAPTPNAIKNVFLDIPQYLRDSVGGRKLLCSSPVVTAVE